MEKLLLFRDIPQYSHKYITGGIRKAFRYSPIYKGALNKARVEFPRRLKSGKISKIPDVYYECAKCLAKFKQKEINVDHIEPIVATDSALEIMSINDYTRRTFYNNLQVLCVYCHRQKTATENAERKKGYR